MDNYVAVLKKALENDAVTVSVQDRSVDYFDLTESRIVAEVIEACEATDDPLVCFYLDGEPAGNMSVVPGYGDESISDHHINEFMEEVVGDAV